MLARRSLPAALGLGFIAPALPAPAPQPRGYSARLPAGLEQKAKNRRLGYGGLYDDA